MESDCPNCSSGSLCDRHVRLALEAEVARLAAIIERVREACQPRPAYSTQAMVRGKFRAEILALLEDK